jgi:hypothetical protein
MNSKIQIRPLIEEDIEPISEAFNRYNGLIYEDKFFS